jgi:hypothetical protein
MYFRAALLASAVCLCHATIAVAKPPPTIGSGNEAVIEPPVPHPAEAPCETTLYSKAKFGASNVYFLYKPPANCPGPYAAIVLSVDISLDAGIQYDRTGTIWVGGVPLWFGTTAEPTPKLGPSWHFERDVTDYTSLLSGANTGFVLIANYTNSTDTSIITSSARLLFYPATTNAPAPTVPDVIIPLAANGGGTVALNSGNDTVAIDQELPTNIARASLDVYLQGQSNDEFWYSCVPNALTAELESCGGGALREGEIKVDNTPAGVAPVYPWIFTGGLDPYLWAPIPGVQTLDFKPFPVELSPFAGVLSNGAKAHRISLSVHGANSYFSVAGALKLYLDHGGAQTTGSITQNTLIGKPSPKITSTLQTTSSSVTGSLNTNSVRNFTIVGNVVTSAGPVQYTVNQVGSFSNDQTFDITDTVYKQFISQNTYTTIQTTAATATGTNSWVTSLSYPLTVDITETVLKSGNISLLNTIGQFYQASKVAVVGGTESDTTEQNGINAADTLILNSSGTAIIGHRDQASAATYATSGSTAPCFQRQLTAANNVLTSEKTGCAK